MKQDPIDPALRPLVDAAKAARHNAHAPYSNYRVGAAVRSESGRIYAGCNVENASYGATLCAERNAIAQMVAAGERQVTACAVVTQGPEPGTPCGICRQVLIEFADDAPVALVAATDAGEKVRCTTLAALLPQPFVLRTAKGDAPP